MCLLCSYQIAEKLELLLTERESLFATWEDNKTELDQAYDLQVFLREAKQIDTLTSTQEVRPMLRVGSDVFHDQQHRIYLFYIVRKQNFVNCDVVYASAIQ